MAYMTHFVPQDFVVGWAAISEEYTTRTYTLHDAYISIWQC